MPKLSLALFGSLQITLDGEPITARLWAKPQALLACLAVEADVPHRREHLAGVLWPEQSDDAARTSLRQALRQLHQVIRDDLAHFLDVTPQTIQFNSSSDCQLDVTEFAVLIRACDQHAHRQRETCRACVERLQRAAALYRGDLLAGFFLKDSAAFEEWALVKREQLRHQAIAALNTLAEHYARRGEFALMEQAARRQIEIDPLYEDAHRQVMRALTWRGQRNAALAQYESLRKALAEEIGAPPEKETLALEASIRDETCPSPPALTNVPHPLTSFIGRQCEVAEVKHLLETTRLLTLTGAGGCGKTRLALQVATAIVHANHFKDGVWWIDLAALRDPALVPQAVAAPFDLSESPGIPLINVLTNYLSSRQSFLILDNCEHLIEACARFVEALLSACPRLRVLTTSRQAFGIGGEVTWRVPSLALPSADQPHTAKEALHCDAIQLFVERAMTVAPNWKLAEHTETVAAICARLDGIPLAIELAAARLKLLSAEQIAARLDARFDLLTNGSRTALPRHQTLRATMDWSYNLLSDVERVLLRRLSVFAGGCTLEAAEAIWAEDNSSVLDGLTALVDKSLVVVEQTDIAMRYRMLETVRQYAREKLIASGEAEAIRDRHLDFFVTFAEEVEPKLRGTEQFHWLDRLEVEHDNLRAALEWSQGQGRLQRGLRLAGALWVFWIKRAYYREGQECVEQLLRQPEVGEKTLARAQALYAAAKCAWSQSNSKLYLEYFEEVIAIARELDQTGKKILVLALADWGYRRWQESALACSRLEEAWTLGQELGDPWIIAFLLRVRGISLLDQRDYKAARSILEESIALCLKIGDVHLAIFSRVDLARLDYREGDYATARSQLEQVSLFFRQVNSRRPLSQALALSGEIARSEGDYSLARQYYNEALAIAQDLSNQSVICVGLSNLGVTALRLGDVSQARKLSVDALTSARETDQDWSVFGALEGLAFVAVVQNQTPRAARLFAAVDSLSKLSGIFPSDRSPADEAETEHNLAIARAQLDEATFNAAWAEGQKMTLEQAIEYALENLNSTVIASPAGVRQSPTRD